MRQIIYFSFLVLLINNSCNENQPYSTKDFVQSKINNTITNCKNGDIILRSGTGVISNMIKKTLNESIPFTHCGIVCKTKDSSYIIHSIAKELSGHDGIQTTSIKEFLKNSYKGEVALFRLKASSEIKAKMVSKAQLYLSQKINFDYSFNLKDSSSMYCTEIIYYALNKKLRENIIKFKTINSHKLILFSTFFNKNNFIEIKI